MNWPWPIRRGRSPDRDVPWIDPHQGEPEGLIGVGGDLSPGMLLRAYSEGVFPWFSAGDPVLWWSPDPRAVIELEHLHVPRRLARTIRSEKFTITVNRCFERVMRACGESRPDGTWVTEEMVSGYVALHRAGFAHSLEVWQGETLAGGIYGVAIGGLFAGESMFHTVRDASKVALVKLVERLNERGFVLFDVQMTTSHTERFGARNIPRDQYLRRVAAAIQLNRVTFI
ncbi:MAG: leucyl/phenylalanyl-tRNA--protein transferase [Gemmataceae bacterium]